MDIFGKLGNDVAQKKDKRIGEQLDREIQDIDGKANELDSDRKNVNKFVFLCQNLFDSFVKEYFRVVRFSALLLCYF